MAEREVKIAILGLGTVGGGTYELLVANKEKIAKAHKVDIQVKKVLDKDVEKLKKVLSEEQIASSIDEIANDSEIEIVVEVMGGVEPAKTFIEKALTSGKSVVTANKELISKHWSELETVARKNKVGLYFEASCVGGVPIIRTLKESLQGDNIETLMGIINGTTNYILTKMSEEGSSYAMALSQAQELGYAEYDPTADVEGYDAMYKLSILSSLAFHTCIPNTKIYREGITNITQEDIASGKALGYTLKLLAIGKKHGDEVEVRVHPTFIPNEHPLASVSGAFNAVFIKGDFVDEVMLYGRGAGARPTGSAIVSDIVQCAKQSAHEYSDFKNNGKVNGNTVIAKDYESKYYVSLTVIDKAGVLASFTQVLGEMGISVHSLSQASSSGGQARIVIMTHTTSEKAMKNAVSKLKKLSCIKSVDSLIRVID